MAAAANKFRLRIPDIGISICEPATRKSSQKKQTGPCVNPGAHSLSRLRDGRMARQLRQGISFGMIPPQTGPEMGDSAGWSGSPDRGEEPRIPRPPIAPSQSPKSGFPGFGIKLCENKNAKFRRVVLPLAG